MATHSSSTGSSQTDNTIWPSCDNEDPFAHYALSFLDPERYDVFCTIMANRTSINTEFWARPDPSVFCMVVSVLVRERSVWLNYSVSSEGFYDKQQEIYKCMVDWLGTEDLAIIRDGGKAPLIEIIESHPLGQAASPNCLAYNARQCFLLVLWRAVRKIVDGTNMKDEWMEWSKSTRNINPR